jgi:hypothetical protein
MTDSIAETVTMDRKKRVVDRYRTQWVAQFLVAAELTRRGYIVAFTMGNSPVIDLMVRVPSSDKPLFVVDVKGASHKMGWFVRRKEQCADLYYIFVCFSEKDRRLDEFYLIPQERVNKLIADFQTMHPKDTKVSGLSYMDVQEFKDKWDKLPKLG